MIKNKSDIPVIVMDLSGYKIIEQSFPFKEEFYRLYQGILENCILQFEKSYGKIDGVIYHDKEKKMIGFTGTQVINKGENRYVSRN